MATSSTRKNDNGDARASSKKTKNPPKVAQLPENLKTRLVALVHAMYKPLPDTLNIKPGWEAFVNESVALDRPDLVKLLEKDPSPPRLMVEIRRYRMPSMYVVPETGQRILLLLHWPPPDPTEPSEDGSDVDSEPSVSDGSDDSDEGDEDPTEPGSSYFDGNSGGASDSDLRDVLHWSPLAGSEDDFLGEFDHELLAELDEDDDRESEDGFELEDHVDDNDGVMRGLRDVEIDNIMANDKVKAWLENQRRSETPTTGARKTMFDDTTEEDLETRTRTRLQNTARKYESAKITATATFNPNNKSMRFVRNLFPNFKKECVTVADMYCRTEPMRGPDGKRLKGNAPYKNSKILLLNFLYIEELIDHLQPDVIIGFGKWVEKFLVKLFGAPDVNDRVRYRKMDEGKAVSLEMKIFFVAHPEWLETWSSYWKLEQQEAVLQRIEQCGLSYDKTFLHKVIDKKKANNAKRQESKTSNTPKTPKPPKAPKKPKPPKAPKAGKRQSKVEKALDLLVSNSAISKDLQLTKAIVKKISASSPGMKWIDRYTKALESDQEDQRAFTRDYLLTYFEDDPQRAIWSRRSIAQLNRFSLGTERGRQERERVSIRYDIDTPEGMDLRNRIGKALRKFQFARREAKKAQRQFTNEGTDRNNMRPPALPPADRYYCILRKCREHRPTLGKILSHMEQDHLGFSFDLREEYNLTEQVVGDDWDLCPVHPCGTYVQQRPKATTPWFAMQAHLRYWHPEFASKLDQMLDEDDFDTYRQSWRAQSKPPAPKESRRFIEEGGEDDAEGEQVLESRRDLLNSLKKNLIRDLE